MRTGEIISRLTKDRVYQLARDLEVALARSNESAKSLATGIARSLGARLGREKSLETVLARLTHDELLGLLTSELADIELEIGNPAFRATPSVQTLSDDKLIALLRAVSPSADDSPTREQLRTRLATVASAPEWDGCLEKVTDATTATAPQMDALLREQRVACIRSLETPRLRELAEQLRLAASERKTREAIIAILSDAQRVPLYSIVAPLTRDELKSMCRAIGLPDDGKEKLALIGRIAGGRPLPTFIATLGDDVSARTIANVLMVLRRDELLDVAADNEIRVDSKDEHDALAQGLLDGGISIAAALEKLPRPRIKEICRSLGVDDGGREKAILVRRLGGQSAEADDAEGHDEESASDKRDNLGILNDALRKVITIDDAGLFWPAKAHVAAYGEQLAVDVYARVIGPTGRNNEERRFQNPSADNPIERSQRPVMLLGAWQEQGPERTVLVAFDAYRRLGKATRFSLFMPLALLEKAADTGFATHVTSSGEELYAFRADSDNLGRYLDLFIAQAPWAVPNAQSARLEEKRRASSPLRAVTAADAIDIRPKSAMYAAFARLNYKPWFALAELVDNAVQSYVANAQRLRELGFEGPLVVDILIEDDEISVTDRAAGIALRDFPRAFSPATPPPDASGLSEFGLGLKAAACWFSREWSVRTSAIGEKVERTVRFDVQDIARSNLDVLPIVSHPAREEDHFTVVSMRNLRVHPKGSTLAKIKEHLGSIYRLLLADGTLRIRVTTNGRSEDLAFHAPKLLTAPYYKDKAGKPILWRKEIDIKLEDRVVTGWVGIMEEGRYSRAGLSVFRRRRLIEGSVGEAYRPRPVFGAHNTFAAQRLVGELYVEGFDVSHTKDGIQWGDYEEDIAYELRLQLTGDDMPMLDQVAGHRARIGAAQLPPDFGEKAFDSTTSPELVEELAEDIRTMKPVLPEDADNNSHPLSAAELMREKTFSLQIDGDVRWDVSLELVRDSANHWIDCRRVAKDDREMIQIALNLDHEFSIEHINSNPRALEPLLRVAIAIGIAERQATIEGVKNVGTIRRHVNELLRGALAKAPIASGGDDR